MSDDAPGTILEYLKYAVPPFCLTDPAPKGSTNTKKYGYKIPKRIEEWDDFEYDSLAEIFDRRVMNVIEQSGTRLRNFIDGVTPIKFVIKAESLLADALGTVSRDTLNEALEAAQTQLYEDDSDHICMVHGDRAKQLFYPESNKSFKPDWAGVRKSLAEAFLHGRGEGPDNILPGETKPSNKFIHEEVQMGSTGHLKAWPRWLRPLVQIYTYCVRTDSRYGYIITDKALIVVRVRPLTDEEWEPDNPNLVSGTEKKPEGSAGSKSGAKKKATGDSQNSIGSLEENRGGPCGAARSRGGMVELKIIPFNPSTEEETRSDESKMTVNLGLFWLHILASQDHYIESGYAPFSEMVWKDHPAENDRAGNYMDISDQEEPDIEDAQPSASDPPKSLSALIDTGDAVNRKKPPKRSKNKDLRNRGRSRAYSRDEDGIFGTPAATPTRTVPSTPSITPNQSFGNPSTNSRRSLGKRARRPRDSSTTGKTRRQSKRRSKTPANAAHE